MQKGDHINVGSVQNSAVGAAAHLAHSAQFTLFLELQ